jgi:hypothetical protein
VPFKLTNRCSYDQETVVAILVGPDEHRFAVHKDIICAKSEFFRAACSTRWLQEKVIRLPEIKPNIFQVYSHWAYADTLVPGATATSTSSNKASSRGLVDLYLLGDVLDDVKFRNKAMQHLITHAAENQQPGFKTICHIWKNTPTSSILRRWTVDLAIMNLKRDYFVEHAEDYPAEFVLQIATKLLQQTKPSGRKKLKEMSSSPEYLEPEGDASVPEA